MRKRMAARLRSRAGETIAETLVALLISSLALLMLAGAITAANRMVTRSRDKLAEYYDADGALALRTDAGAEMQVVLTEEPGDDGSTLDPQTHRVTYYVNAEFNGTEVISYAPASPPGGGD